MNAMFLVLGDWYSSVYGNYEKLLVLSNKTVDEIQDAYKASVKLTGVSFSCNNSHADQEEACSHYIAVESGQGFEVSNETKQMLKLHGYDFAEHMTVGFNKEGDQIELNSIIFLHIWTEFVKLSLPDLIITHTSSSIPVINGYWDDKLNVRFACGLY